MKRVAILGLISVLALSGMLGLSAAPSAQAQDSLHVVASFSILADVVGQVGGAAVAVDTLIPLGSNPHAFEPSARDVATLSDADLVFTVGINFEEGLLNVLGEAAGDRAVVVSECVPVLPVTAGDHAHSHDPAHDHMQGESGIDCETHHHETAVVFGVDHIDLAGALGTVSEGICDTESCDPHVWTDPVNVALWTLAIRDALSAHDPDNAALYAQNADAYLLELAALDADIHALFDTISAEQRIMVTNHLSFNYLAARYGLTTVGVILPGGSTGSEPSARDVIDLIDTIKNAGVRAIFTETTVSDALASQIADETGAQIVQLYTGSLSEADGPAATYLAYVRFNAEQIAAAVQ